ncbi:MAG: hypothetical protein SynsKO_33960 [Synoicihabitans sp.]
MSGFRKLHLVFAVGLWLPLLGWAQSAEKGPELVAPEAFTLNCNACHLLDQALVGPSLVEIAELYPPANLDAFIQWCIEPQKKRDQMVEMPSMVHVPKADLVEIYHYIRLATVGVTRVKRPVNDPFATSPAKTRRPRVQRTFLPETGPASMVVALPTSQKFNLIWDTDQCRLRYISSGEPDSWQYWRSNGNALAEIGEVCYRESDPLFAAAEVRFMGYHISAEGMPAFVYRVGENTVTEKITTRGDQVVRTFTGSPRLPEYELPRDQGDQLKISAKFSENTLTLIHRPLP